MSEAGALEKKAPSKYSALRDEIRLKNGKGVDTTDVIPERETERPAIFAGGWAQVMTVYDEAYKTIAERGRRIIGFEHPRWGARVGAIEPENLSEKDRKLLEPLPRSILRKAYTLLGVGDAKKLDSMPVIAHSEGFLAAAAAAIADPRIRNIVAIAPAGFFKEQVDENSAYFARLRALAGRSGMQKSEIEKQMPDPNDPEARALEDGSPEAQKRRREWLDRGDVILGDQTPEELALAKEVGSIAGTEGPIFTAKNLVRAYNELVGLINVDITPIVEELVRRGVGITIILPESDSVYPVYDDKENKYPYPVRGTREKIRSIKGIEVVDVPGDHGQAGERMGIVQIAAAKLAALEKAENSRSPRLMDRLKDVK